MMRNRKRPSELILELARSEDEQYLRLMQSLDVRSMPPIVHIRTVQSATTTLKQRISEYRRQWQTLHPSWPLQPVPWEQATVQ